MTRITPGLVLTLAWGLALGAPLLAAGPAVLEDDASAEASSADSDDKGTDDKGTGAADNAGSDKSSPEPAEKGTEAPPARSNAAPARGGVVADFSTRANGAEGPRSKKLSFNFDNAPWKLVLNLFAAESGLTLDMPDTEVPPGTFTYRDSKPYTPTEALDIINGYLLKRGFLLVRRDRFLVVVNIDNPIPPNLIPQVTVDELPGRGRYELMSVVLPLGDIDAKTAAEEVKDMVGPQGKVQTMGATNRLLVTDIGENLQIIQRTLADIAAVKEPKSQTFRSFKLLHISATEAERTVRDLFGLPPKGQRTATATTSSSQSDSDRRDRGGRGGFPWGGGGFPWGGGGGGGGGWGGWGGGGRGGRDRGDRGDRDRGDDKEGENGKSPSQPSSTTRVLLASDSRTNTLMVTCTVEDMRFVEEAIKSIDVKQEPSERQTPRGKGAPKVEGYTLETADPQVVMDMLTSVIPGIVIYDDPKSHRLNVYATASEHEQITELIKELDSGASDQVVVIPLIRLDPALAAATLKALYSNSTKTDPPAIEADATGHRLLVRGSPDQLSQIKKLLTDMGEIAGLSKEGDRDKGPFRIITPRGRSATEVVSVIEKLFPQEQGSFIRVVRPAVAGTQRSPRRIDSPKDEEGPQFQRRPPRRPATFDDPASEPPADVNENQGTLRGPSKENERGLRRTSAERQADPSSDGLRAGAATIAASETDDIEKLSQQLEEALRSGDGEVLDDEAEGAQPAETPREASGEAASPRAGTTISVVGDNIMVYSKDKGELDRMENLIQALSSTGPQKTKWTVYPCQLTEATELANMLSNLFPEGTVSRQTQQTGFGPFTLRAGLNSDTGTLSKSGALRIVPHVERNTLYITGPEDIVAQVMEAIEVLDASDLPQALKDRVPRTIAVEHADVQDVAAIVRDVYKEQMDGGGQQPNQQNRGGGGFNPFNMFASFGQQNQPQGRQGRPVQLSIGVDARTNSLIVSASDPLFRQVQELVRSLDESAQQARRTVRVVSLKNANSTVVQETLTSLMGKVKTNAPRSTHNGAAAPGTNQNNTQDQNQKQSQNDPNQTAGTDPASMFLQQQMMQRAFRGGRGGFGGGFGGGRGGRGN